MAHRLNHPSALTTTVDKFLDGKVLIEQPEHGYRAGIDAVLLAAAVRPKPNEKVLDVGAGVGTVMLCLATHYKEITVTGLEIQTDLVELNEQNIQRNQLQGRINIVQGDITSPPKELTPNSFDHVLSNPPFHEYGQQSHSDSAEKALARHMTTVSLKNWIQGCLKYVKPRGHLTLIHRADLTDDIIHYLKPKAGAIKIFPLWPNQDKAAKLVVIQARKSVKSACKILQGLRLHDEEGNYTHQAEAIFRGQAQLEL